MHTSSRKKTKRVIALVFLLCFVMLALLSEAVVLTRSHHEHDHLALDGGCAVCAQIHSVENLLKQFGAAAAALPIGWFGLFAAIALLYGISASRYATPVRLKIRLNN